MNNLNIYCDGGSRGNPGEAAIGVYIENEKGETIEKISERIGFGTNNEAEYKAVIRALEWLIQNQNLVTENTKIEFFLDSQLVYSQINGLFKVKNERIRVLLFQVRQKEALLKNPPLYFHILREKNKKADLLVNLALDNKA